MSKLKSHRGASKRFKVTASGKVKSRRANRSHILTKKSPKRKRQLRSSNLMLSAPDAKMVKRMLNGG
ncbi:50S ribosomal protein L35 [Legionella sp. W05-934-2]|jgi:large subunit ribosomal protein L35|uniref:50S ribosomal protein L35 n=1 Tax=Legionella sp. W05-934-2 TaxID=1198649 RepID=UPI003462A5B9